MVILSRPDFISPDESDSFLRSKSVIFSQNNDDSKHYYYVPDTVLSAFHAWLDLILALNI